MQGRSQAIRRVGSLHEKNAWTFLSIITVILEHALAHGCSDPIYCVLTTQIVIVDLFVHSSGPFHTF